LPPLFYDCCFIRGNRLIGPVEARSNGHRRNDRRVRHTAGRNIGRSFRGIPRSVHSYRAVGSTKCCHSNPSVHERDNLLASTQHTVLESARPYTLATDRRVPVQTTHDAYKAASLNTFDPFVYPIVGVQTMFGNGSGSNYATRYSRVFADNAIGNFMTSAVVPSLTGEDSRYYRRGTGGVFSRLAYAASRSVVTRTRSGGKAFNISEIGGNAVAAGLSNLYYSPSDRTVGATVARCATQIGWDTLANELKEFWPDISARLRSKR